MKLTKQQPQTEQPSLDMAVSNAIGAAPSRAKLIAAKEKLAETIASANVECAEIERLEKKKAAKDGLAKQAIDFLSGKAISHEDIAKSIAAATQRANVLKEAIRIQQAVIRQIETDVYLEVSIALKALRQPLVSRMDAALQELQAVAEEDSILRTAIAQGGAKAPVGGGGDFVTTHPAMRGLPAYQNWRACMRAQGYTLSDRPIAVATETALRLPM